MAYPVILGTGRLPDNRKEFYSEETHEYLILTCDETVAYVRCTPFPQALIYSAR